MRLDRERLAGPDPGLDLFFLIIVHPAEKRIHLAVDRVVHAEQVLVLHQVVGIVVEIPRITRVRCGRQARISGDPGVDLQQVGAQRLPQRLGNHVIWEGRAPSDVTGAVTCQGPRLEDRPVLELRRVRHVGGKQPGAEIPAEDFRVGDVRVRAGGKVAARHLPVVEEEQFLGLVGRDFRYRHPAAEIAAELVVAQLRLQRIAQHALGIQRIVAEVLVCGAVELSGAGLGLHRDHHAGITAVLGVEAALQYPELRDCVDTGLCVLRLVVAGVDIRRPVQVEVVLRSAPAQRVELRHVVEVHIEIALGGAAHAWDRVHQRGKVAAVHGQLRHLRPVYQKSLFHGIGRDHGRAVALHGHGLTHIADLELDLSNVHLGIDVEGNREFSLLESGLLDTDEIAARLNVNGLESAQVIGTGLSCSASFGHVNDSDRGPRHDAAGSVYNGTADVL